MLIHDSQGNPFELPETVYVVGLPLESVDFADGMDSIPREDVFFKNGQSAKTVTVLTDADLAERYLEKVQRTNPLRSDLVVHPVQIAGIPDMLIALMAQRVKFITFDIENHHGNTLWTVLQLIKEIRTGLESRRGSET